MAGRKNRKSLTLADRMKFISEVKAGKPLGDACLDFGIGKTQAYKILKAKDTIQKCITSGSVPVDSKLVQNKSKHPEIDLAVFEWFCSVRTFRGAHKSLPVSRMMIQARAMHEARLKGISTFKASNGWFSRWRWRYNVTKHVKLHGESGDVNVQESEQDIELLRQTLLTYDQCNVFNMDECGLFYRMIPNKSYLLVSEGDSRQHGHGCKAMRAKERITIVFCTNATGTQKVAPVIIGSAAKPRCFRNSPPCLPYFNQRNAWNDRKNYQKWWNEIFLPSIRQFTSQPVALLLDGFSGHCEDCTDPQVTVFKFPPNVTSVYQPLDQGIIAAFKAGYKSRLLSRMVENIANYQQLQTLAKQLPAGHAGLSYASPPNISDAITLTKEVWDSLSPSTIAACWGHSRCFSASQAAELSAARDYVKYLDEECIKNMCDMLDSLKVKDPIALEATGIDVASLAQDIHTSVHDVLSKWLHLEEELMVPVNEEEQNEEEENDENDTDSVSPVEKLCHLKECLPLLHGLHAIGVRINDGHLTDVARNLCLYIKEQSTASP